MIYAQPNRENGTHKPIRNFWHTNGSPNISQKTGSYRNQQKKKRTCKSVNFAVLADHRIKLKEYEKKNKYLNFAMKLKKYKNGTWRWQLYQL